MLLCVLSVWSSALFVAITVDDNYLSIGIIPFRHQVHHNLFHSKHETLNQCWYNVGPTSATLAQHYINIGSASRVCCINHWIATPVYGYQQVLEHNKICH